MLSVVFAALRDSKLPVHHRGKLFRIVRGKKAVFLLGVDFDLLANVFLHRIPNVIYVDRWLPFENSFKGASKHVQN